MSSDLLARLLEHHPRILTTASLTVASLALGDALLGHSDLLTRVLLGLAGGGVLVASLTLLSQAAGAAIRGFFSPPSPTGAGYSYQELKLQILLRLRWNVRSLLALISLFVIGQVLAGFLLLAGSALTIMAIEATMWTGVLLGLHLGWRSWQLLRSIGRRRFEMMI